MRYHGPHFMVFELQSRWVASVFNENLKTENWKTRFQDNIINRKSFEKIQFPYGNVVKNCIEISQKINLYPSDLMGKNIPLLPHHFSDTKI